MFILFIAIILVSNISKYNRNIAIKEAQKTLGTIYTVRKAFYEENDRCIVSFEGLKNFGIEIPKDASCSYSIGYNHTASTFTIFAQYSNTMYSINQDNVFSVREF